MHPAQFSHSYIHPSADPLSTPPKAVNTTMSSSTDEVFRPTPPPHLNDADSSDHGSTHHRRSTSESYPIPLPFVTEFRPSWPHANERSHESHGSLRDDR